ncbi:MAG: 50S ribosomal protein L35 [Candidatus Lindowbacteria bacterium RIFCSPLOWO2_12_FULL_62_27]|nr:MAG: 50S ribosomal protein L35 [Candidatus Lindowbacteria bacterium RIFCSPLOWO2_12_FULL_62_27]
MPKIKTNRAAAKRFKRTGGGKWVRRRAFGRHLLTDKSRKRKRSYQSVEVVHPTDRVRLTRLMPYAA